MRLEDRRPRARLALLLRRLTIGAALAAAVALPLWLYQTRGRKLPLTVLVVAERTVVATGQEVTIASRLRPADRHVERQWFGPGVPAAKPAPASFRWRAPAKPGVYTLRLRVRRSGRFAEDAISLQVVAKPLSELPQERPTPPAKVPKAPLCAPAKTAALQKSSALIAHGRVCPGLRIVAELRRAKGSWGPIWLGLTAETLDRGRLRELWVPAGPATLRARFFDRAERCVHELSQPLPLAPDCMAAAKAALRADFGWQLRGPGDFVLLAKPPRPPVAAVYQWDLGDGQLRTTNRASLPYRYTGKAQRYRIVRLTMQVGSRRASTLRLLIDRTVVP